MYPIMLTRLLHMCRVNPSSDSDKVTVRVTCSHYHIRAADAGLLKIDRCWASSPVLDNKFIYICGECTFARLICSLNLCHRWYILSNNPPLTHWGRDKKAAIFQTTFWNGFSWMKIYELRLRSHWSLFPWLELIIFQHWHR